ncbi:MAG: hypothetical protein UU24_C0006G0019 [Candidatus Nomurabacteria bacterium GW2011_GWA2_40_9]|uniref:MobA-like NTP transferase domain-containing protein n=1 Tax=Candidatus Nomurabacteria bacterium GW2011_GWA2_40_9 TaxID=1618734 RepID=A0A0G0W5L4_9BACT|nr:MAG: hypothetical protein UU24_C0006G0019 [Candidatus Nomurabacteria bacterium GW2011_GWA2_40_9]
MKQPITPKLIILAAGEGSRLKPYTLDKPKCLVPLHGKSILSWQVSLAHQFNIYDIIVVKGYKHEKIQENHIRSYINTAYDHTNMVETLWCAQEEFKEDIIISYGDILYNADVLSALIQSPHDISVVIDKDWLQYWKQRFINPLEDAESLHIDSSGKILEIGQKVSDYTKIQGQFIGLMRFKNNGIKALKNFYMLAKEETGCGKKIFRTPRPFHKIFMTDFLQGMIDFGYPILEVPIKRNWLEIDSPSDYDLAKQITISETSQLKFLS